MTSPKISVLQLRRLIREEAKAQSVHAAKAAVSGAASKLLGAIDDFKEKATPAALGAATQHMAELEKLLNHMTDAPGAYIEKQKVEPRQVSLRAVSND